MKVTVESYVQHLCPYRDEKDGGTAELTLDVVEGDAPELHDLYERLRHYKVAERISHEDFTRSLAFEFGASRVLTRWNTAGLKVSVEVVRP